MNQRAATSQMSSNTAMLATCAEKTFIVTRAAAELRAR
jgi:hypothetical protein